MGVYMGSLPGTEARGQAVLNCELPVELPGLFRGRRFLHTSPIKI